jgi:phosphatidylglycerol:prolipoprotein diacylglycerol transferase
MIPYVAEPVIGVGPFHLYAYSVLGAMAIVAAGWIILRRSRRFGIELDPAFRFCFWMYAGALAGAHLAAVSDPLMFFRDLSGLNSSGGLGGALLAGLAWCLWNRLPLREILRRFDIVAYALPAACMFGRLGCALAHDHRGALSASWIAVQFPEGPRLDLGLIEFIFLAVLAILFRLLDRRPEPPGFFLGLSAVAYGAFRIWLGTLRIEPVSLFPGLALIAIGLTAWGAMVWLRPHLRSQRIFKRPCTTGP